MTQTPENQQQYGSILTVLGENAEQNGKLQNKQITFTHIAIGDANDTYVQPDRSQTALINELARIPVNSVDVLQPTPDSVPMLKVEAILPDNVNDLVIREFAAVASFNDQTYFHAIGNCARIYVPPPVNNGNVLTPVTLEMIFVITSADPIVEIDPNVVTASREWVNKGVKDNILPFNVFRTVNEKLQDFVSVKDFGAVGDGVVDDTDAIQAALDTKSPIFIPGGKWKVTRNLTFYAGQTIEGVSNPEKSLYVPNNTTQIIVDGHVGGLEHRSVGLANGARFKDFTLKTSEQHPAGSGTQGLEIGKWGGGVPGDTDEDPDAWKYQAIRLSIDNVMIQGFDVNASFWGWCWEMSFNRFYTFKDSTTGTRFGRGVTGVNTLIQCSFLSSNPDTIAGNLGGTSLLLDQGASITCFNCRWEGANGTGVRVKNGSKLEAYTPYFESNYDFDVLVSGTKCDVKIIGGESDYGHTHTACLAVKEDEDNAPHNIIFKDFKHNSFDPVTMKPKYCSWFITNPYANVRLENIDDNTDVPFLDFRIPPDYMTFSKFPGVTLRSTRSNVSERKLPWNQGGAKLEVDGNSLPASLVIGYDGFDLIQQAGSGIAHVGHRRYALHNDKWIISAPLSYRNIGVRNMSGFPATVKIEDYAGIKIYRYTGQPSTAELTLDLTNAMVGMDFEITIEKTDILPTSITLKDQTGTVIDTIEPGANGFYGKWVMTNFQGSGITFKKMMAMPY